MARVLVVDDSQAMRHYVAAGLSADFEVGIASDGVQALGILAQSKFDLVISDIEMPNMTGLELARTLEATAPEIPVVLMTDADIDSFLHEARKCHVSHIFPKQMLSVDFQALLRSITGILKRAPIGLAGFLSPGGEVRTFVLGGEPGDVEGLETKVLPILDHFPRGEIYTAVFSLLIQSALAQVETRRYQGFESLIQVGVGGDRRRVGLSVQGPWQGTSLTWAYEALTSTQSAGSNGWVFQMVRRILDRCHIFLGDDTIEVVCLDILDGYDGPKPLSIFR